MSKETALSIIPEGLSPELTAKLENFVTAVDRQNIAVLGDGEVFVRRTEEGIIKAVAGALTLKESNGQIAMISGKPMITATGYYDQNKIASCTIITPEKLTLPGVNQTVPNPYPIIDPESQTIAKVWVKKMCLGRNPIGNWVMSSCTLLYDINMYFLQDCFNKIAKNKKAGRVTMKPMLKAEEIPLFLPIHGTMGILINPEDADIIKAMETFIQKKLFAERLAQTICERIVMKKHAAFTSTAEVSTEKGKAAAKIKITGWVNDLTKDDLLRISRKLERGEEVNIDGQSITINDETLSEIPEEDRYLEVEEDETANNDPISEDGDNGNDAPQNEEIPANDNSVPSAGNDVMRKIKKGIEIIGQDAAEAIYKKNFNKPIEQLREKQLEMFLKLMMEEADKGGVM